MAIALVVGVTAGYAGGPIDSVLTRITDVGLAFPTLLLALAIAGFLGSGLRNAMIALAAVMWAHQARIIRAETLPPSAAGGSSRRPWHRAAPRWTSSAATCCPTWRRR